MPVLLDFTIKSLKLATGVVCANSFPQDGTSVANRVFKEVRIEAWYCDPVARSWVVSTTRFVL